MARPARDVIYTAHIAGFARGCPRPGPWSRGREVAGARAAAPTSGSWVAASGSALRRPRPRRGTRALAPTSSTDPALFGGAAEVGVAEGSKVDKPEPPHNLRAW